MASGAQGGLHSIALLDNSQVQVWGRNSQGQLGIGSRTDQNTPYTIPG